MQLTLLHAPLLPRHTIGGRALKIKIDAHTRTVQQTFICALAHTHTLAHSNTRTHTFSPQIAANSDQTLATLAAIRIRVRVHSSSKKLVKTSPKSR